MVRSYDGFAMNDPDMITSFNHGTSDVMTELLCRSDGCCSVCSKPMITYDNMATSMQAKMNYLAMINEQQKASDDG